MIFHVNQFISEVYDLNFLFNSGRTSLVYFLKEVRFTYKADDNCRSLMEKACQISLIPLSIEIYGKRRKGIQHTIF